MANSAAKLCLGLAAISSGMLSNDAVASLDICRDLTRRAGIAVASKFHWYRIAHKILPIALDHAIWHAKLSPDLQELAIRIHKNWSQEQDQLFLASFGSDPARFGSLGDARAAATGDAVGDPVFLNDDAPAAAGLGDALALLVHEYGHHHGIRDDQARLLDNLADKITSSLQIESSALTVTGTEGIVATRLYIKNRPPYHWLQFAFNERVGAWLHMHQEDYGYGSHLLLSDGVSIIDVREQMIPALKQKGLALETALDVQKWSFDAERGDLGLHLSTRQGDEMTKPDHWELRFGLVREGSAADWRLAARAPNIRMLATPSELLDIARGWLLFHQSNQEMTIRDLRVSRRESELTMTFVVPAELMANFDFYPLWGRLDKLGGPKALTRLSSDHPLVAGARILSVEKLGHAESRVTLSFSNLPEDVDESLRFLGLRTYGGFLQDASLWSLPQRWLVPEWIVPLLP